ncbi:MAG: MATE family efflux transporter [Deltaproteobacteria bacterium]|nr:MATE family efflux transporter [Deltaproteobacteria bacterium]
MTEAAAAPRLRTLLELAWPVVVSRSTQVVVGLTDAVMVASLGEAALAATTTGALNTFNLLILPMGIVFIVQSFASQLFGKGDLPGARRYAWYGLSVALVTGLASMIVQPFVGPALGLLTYEDAVRQQMTAYLEIRLLSAAAAIGIEALGAYYGGLGNTRMPMFANVLAMVANVALNWVFIYGHLGVPALGVTGAAIASAVASWIAFAGLFTAFYTGRGGGAGRASKLQFRELRRMLRFGLPSGLNWFFEFLAFSFFVNVVVAGLGTTSLAAMMAVLQLNSMSFMPAFGFATAAAILVGQAIGADRKQDVPPTTLLALKVVSTWQGLVGLAYLAFPGGLLAPFATQASSEFVEVGRRMLMLSVAWQLFDAASITLGEVLRAAGDTSFPMWARTAIAWLLFAPGSYWTVSVRGGGDLAAIGWIVFYLFSLCAVLTYRFRSGAWRHIELVDPLASVEASAPQLPP